MNGVCTYSLSMTTNVVLYTRLTPEDLVAIAKASGDEVTHLRAMVSALAGVIKRRCSSEFISDNALFAAIEAAAGAAMHANEDDDCIVEVRR